MTGYTYAQKRVTVNNVAGIDRKGTAIVIKGKRTPVIVNSKTDALGQETITSVTVLSDASARGRAVNRIDAKNLLTLTN